MVKLYKSFAILFLASFFLPSANALDLNKAKFPLYYECHVEEAAGLFLEKETGELKATVFSINKADKWQMRIEKITSEKELSKFDENCAYERKGYAASGPIRGVDFPPAMFARPQFCVINTYSNKSRSIESASYCRISSLKKGDGTLECGITSSFYFDSDRTEGIKSDTDLTVVSAGFVTNASINKIRCVRLDR